MRTGNECDHLGSELDERFSVFRFVEDAFQRGFRCCPVDLGFGCFSKRACEWRLGRVCRLHAKSPNELRLDEGLGGGLALSHIGQAAKLMAKALWAAALAATGCRSGCFDDD